MNITKRVSKKGDVSFLIRVSVGYDGNNKQIMKSMTYKPEKGMTVKQAEKEANRQAVLFEDKCKSNDLANKKIKFQVLADEWLQERELVQDIKPSTLVRMKTLKERTYKAIGHIYVDKLSYRMIRDFIQSLAKDGVNKTTGGGLSQKTQKHYLTFISDIMKYAKVCGYIENNPCSGVKTVKTESQQRQVYSLEEMQVLLQRINAKADLQHKVMFNLLAYYGMRKGELMGIEFKDIDFSNNTLNIVRTSNYQNKSTGIYTSTPKTKSSIRQLLLQTELVAMISELYKEQREQAKKCGDLWVNSDRLFINWCGEPMRPYYPYRWLKNFCEAEGLTFKGLHSFRHTVATQSITNGIDISTVSKVLGHSNTTTTLNIYTHEVTKAKAQALNLYADLLNGSTKTT